MSMELLARTLLKAIETGEPLPLNFASKQVINIQIPGAVAATDFLVHYICPFNGNLTKVEATFSGAATGTASIAVHKADSGSSPTAGTPMTEELDVSSASDQYNIRQIPIITAERAVTAGQMIGLVDGGTIAGLDNLVVTMTFEVINF